MGQLWAGYLWVAGFVVSCLERLDWVNQHKRSEMIEVVGGEWVRGARVLPARLP